MDMNISAHIYNEGLRVVESTDWTYFIYISIVWHTFKLKVSMVVIEKNNLQVDFSTCYCVGLDGLMSLLFLAVQNSSIGDLVPWSLCLLPLTIRVFTTIQSEPRDL